MTEVEALKRFIPILGRISPPGERVIITRSILERIAGRHTAIMGVNHKHAGALAWPNDTTKAGEFESAMDNAVDAGEFVSFIHQVDRRHFQIEELASWPGCPAIAPDSPLVFWLGEPVPAQTTTPAHVETVEERRARYLEWHTEEHRINPRGALQRVFEREAKQNPKADRANIGKDIDKARGAAKTQKLATAWTSQLVQDGKRKG